MTNKYLFGIVVGHIPLSRTRPYKSALSECMRVVNRIRGMRHVLRQRLFDAGQVAQCPQFEGCITDAHKGQL